MKLYLILAAAALVIGTKAMAGDVSLCSKLKITGRHECKHGNDSLILSIKKVQGTLKVTAETENEVFVIDGTERARYNWSQDFTYTSSCTKSSLKIDSFNKGQSEGTIQIKQRGSSILYSISKDGHGMALECNKL